MKFVATIFLVCASLQIALALDLQEAVEIIKSSFPNSGLGVGKPLCQTYSCCNLTETETCSLSSMPKDKTMLVLPGGETRCIYSDSTPYAFQVVPGDSDKLVFYFQVRFQINVPLIKLKSINARVVVLVGTNFPPRQASAPQIPVLHPQTEFSNAMSLETL